MPQHTHNAMDTKRHLRAPLVKISIQVLDIHPSEPSIKPMRHHLRLQISVQLLPIGDGYKVPHEHFPDTLSLVVRRDREGIKVFAKKTPNQ